MFGDEELKRLGQKPAYRFAVETDFDGSIAQISFVVLSGSLPILIWAIPLDSSASKVASLWEEEEQGVELPAPSVGLPKPDAKRSSANDE